MLWLLLYAIATIQTGIMGGKMIAKLFGSVDSVLDDGVILNVSGVGYFVLMSTSSLVALSENEDICLHIEHVVRPEAITLYGFQSSQEKKLFQKLTSVQGVGGKSALSILSVLMPKQVVEAICNNEVASFKKADGVGPKVAARIITELKDYASKERVAGMASIPAEVGYEDASLPSHTKVVDDAISTLIQLGYRKQESASVVEAVFAEDPSLSVEKIIPLALKKLSKHLG